jgi:hypothetical protein
MAYVTKSDIIAEPVWKPEIPLSIDDIPIGRRLDDFTVGYLALMAHQKRIYKETLSRWKFNFYHDGNLRAKHVHCGKPFRGPDGKHVNLDGTFLKGVCEEESGGLTICNLENHPKFKDWFKSIHKEKDSEPMTASSSSTNPPEKQKTSAANQEPNSTITAHPSMTPAPRAIETSRNSLRKQIRFKSIHEEKDPEPVKASSTSTNPPEKQKTSAANQEPNSTITAHPSMTPAPRATETMFEVLVQEPANPEWCEERRQLERGFLHFCRHIEQASQMLDDGEHKDHMHRLQFIAMGCLWGSGKKVNRATERKEGDDDASK